MENILRDAGEIACVNTATGSSEVQAGKLFDRFFTVEAAHNANGLGLAMARTSLEQMGGTISAQYEDGKRGIVEGLPA